MHKLLLVASVAALALPAAALAQDTDMTPDGAPPPVASDYGANAAYTGAPGDLSAREDWLGRRITWNENADTITGFAAYRDRQLLGAIRRRQNFLETDHDGLTPTDHADLSAQLDGLDARLNAQLGEGH